VAHQGRIEKEMVAELYHLKVRGRQAETYKKSGATLGHNLSTSRVEPR